MSILTFQKEDVGVQYNVVFPFIAIELNFIFLFIMLCSEINNVLTNSLLLGLKLLENIRKLRVKRIVWRKGVMFITKL